LRILNAKVEISPCQERNEIGQVGGVDCRWKILPQASQMMHLIMHAGQDLSALLI